jgi:hypothetical protein
MFNLDQNWLDSPLIHTLTLDEKSWIFLNLKARCMLLVLTDIHIGQIEVSYYAPFGGRD